MTSAEAVTEQDALHWYEFVQERHAEELRESYPTTDSTPATDTYREQYRAAQSSYQDVVDAVHCGDQAAAEEHLAGLKERARKWAAHPDHPEASPA
ncbi:hypothetical protein B9W64_37870 [Streptomyces sp. CS159]|uniref:hypothetical protein n=1 Tax=Streptomyces sp. CS159 TaxID=1982762 RepID=UPI000B4162D4|nr:hypothetical protein [Streptomyces sp. CS159]OVZ99564.1 hypothetical protein B9W64_37870 [Streptomyces sp. CS159]